jgi:hypothetical protein
MKCDAARAFLLQISAREAQITEVPQTDLDYLSANGYVLRASKEDYDRGVAEVAKLTDLVAHMRSEKEEEEKADLALRSDEEKEHSFKFHFEGKEEKTELRERVDQEATVVNREKSELTAMEANVNSLIQEKSTMDRMVPYDGGYLALTDLGTVILNDLGVRNYRFADQEFAEFLSEIQATYAELRSIADKGAIYVNLIKPKVPGTKEMDHPVVEDVEELGELMHEVHEAQSMLWGTAIGLGKLQGDSNSIGERFTQAFNILQHHDSTIPNKLMAAEIMTATAGQDIRSLEGVFKNLDGQLRKQGVPKELSAGVAATIMAGRRYDGTYPVDRFSQFRQATSSCEAASILAVMNVSYDELNSKFQGFRSLFNSWGYMKSEDTEIASAFLAIGELGVDEVVEKLKYVEEQLKVYLGYPLVAAAILASIPVFEAHEVLDLMEKAVTLLTGYTSGLERSELVALAVRMIHGVRNELVKEIDSTAKIAATPVQFTYAPHPGLFIWYHPVIVAHAAYHSTFSGIGGFHPAHSHGVGGFAG